MILCIVFSLKIYMLFFYLQIILSQEKNIQQLNELIESLQRQLLHCRGSNNTVHTTTVSHTEVSEVDGQESIDD